MGVATGIGAAVNLGGSIFKTVSGARNVRQAREAARKYRRQELRNVYENIQVSQLGSDLQREELSRTTATAIDALRNAGARGILGGLGRVTAQANVLNRQIAADLDEQQTNINRLIAEDESRIRQLQENREIQDLSGIGQQLNVGRQDVFSGIGDIAQTGASIGRLAQAGAFGNLGSGTGTTTSVPTATNLNTPAPFYPFNPFNPTFGGLGSLGGFPQQGTTPSFGL